MQVVAGEHDCGLGPFIPPRQVVGLSAFARASVNIDVGCYLQTPEETNLCFLFLSISLWYPSLDSLDFIQEDC